MANLFQDNQNACVVTLEQEFSIVYMKTFPNVFAYYQCLKTLSDQLCGISALVNNHSMLLRFISDVIGTYQGVSTLIRQSNLLPFFNQAISLLTLEDYGLSKMTPTESLATYRTTQQRPSDDSS